MVLPCGLPELHRLPRDGARAWAAAALAQLLHPVLVWRSQNPLKVTVLATTLPHCVCAACAWYNYLSFSLLPWTAEGIKYTPRSAPVCAPHVLEEQ